jgi:hypothetical protein
MTQPPIAIVDSTGKLIGVGPGTTDITAAYNGLVATQAVEVIGVPPLPTALIHRYTLNDGTANDSIGTNNGTFYDASGQSSISAIQVNLAGLSGDYVDPGADLITTNALASGAFSLEAWCTISPVNGSWARIFDFGAINGLAGGNYIFLTSNNGLNSGSARLAVSDVSPGYNNETGFSFNNLLGQTHAHVVAVFNPTPGRQFLGLYLNGTLIASVPTGNKVDRVH